MLKELAQVGGAVGEELALTHPIPHFYERYAAHVGCILDDVFFAFFVLNVGSHDDYLFLAVIFYLDHLACNPRDHCGIAGAAALKDLLNARKAVGHIAPRRGGASGVLYVHGELGTRLAYGLRRHGAYRLAQRHRLHGAQVGAVATHTQPACGAASNRRAHIYRRGARLLYTLGVRPEEELPLLVPDLARELHVFCQIAALDVFGEEGAYTGSALSRDSEPFFGATVLPRDDNIL